MPPQWAKQRHGMQAVHEFPTCKVRSIGSSGPWWLLEMILVITRAEAQRGTYLLSSLMMREGKGKWRGSLKLARTIMY
eukprot:scaffold6170_cov136-Skeletonema_menzelii.AAC.3